MWQSGAVLGVTFTPDFSAHTPPSVGTSPVRLWHRRETHSSVALSATVACWLAQARTP